MRAQTIVLLLAAVIGWRVWYNPVRNGGAEATKRYSCLGEEACSVLWKALPPTGFQVLMIYYDDGRRRIVQGTDYYWRCDEREDGICHGQEDPGGDRRLGLTISDEEFDRIHSEAWASAAPGE